VATRGERVGSTRYSLQDSGPWSWGGATGARISAAVLTV
jgi:hypothetical protein